ncbi:MAG: hypothetical protein IPL32_19100 [Chloracidobacterium sp.]|nr:hypothetical protein [Chloracidobacterium sp.]
MNSMTEALDTLFPSIFDDEDNVYNTDQLGSEVRPRRSPSANALKPLRGRTRRHIVALDSLA